MEWSYELAECCRANCTDFRTVHQQFYAYNSIPLVGKAIDMMREEGRKVDGIIFSNGAFHRMMLYTDRRTMCSPSELLKYPLDGFCIYGIPSMAYPDEMADAFSECMYMLCDFFDEEKSTVIGIRFI